MEAHLKDMEPMKGIGKAHVCACVTKRGGCREVQYFICRKKEKFKLEYFAFHANRIRVKCGKSKH